MFQKIYKFDRQFPTRAHTVAKLASMRFLRERSRLSQKARGDAKREAEFRVHNYLN